DGGTGRVSYKNAFFSGNFTGENGCCFVGNFFKMVNYAEIHAFGEEIFPDAFGDIGINFVFVENAGFVIFLEYVAESINSPDQNVSFFFFDETSCSGNGTSSSYAPYEVCDFAFGLFPDFGSGGFVMGLK